MKKSIIALMGLFTLVACSEESYQEADKMNNSGAVENTGMQNSVKTVDPSIGYISPYETGNAGQAIAYKAFNHTPFELRLTPYVGLAYYDGADDGWYNHPNLSSPIDLNSGSYTNIYNNGKEYLNLIECPAITLLQYSSFAGGGTKHLETGASNVLTFDVVGAGASIDEENLLTDYGKIYYYKIELVDPLTNNTIFTDTYRLDFNSSSPGSPWVNTGETSMFADDLYYHNTTAEIVAANNNTPSFHYLHYMGINYDIKFFSSDSEVIIHVQR